METRFITVIDHQDSFTWNLVHLLERRATTRVLSSADVGRARLRPNEIIVFSPGPGNPSDYPDTLSFYRRFRNTHPMLGVCLGFQVILQAEGAKIISQARILHGVQSVIDYAPDCIAYHGISSPLHVGRYHSLQVDPDSIDGQFRVTGTDRDTGAPLSVEHRQLPIIAFQYHPDSFLTPLGARILDNVLDAFLAHLGSQNGLDESVRDGRESERCGSLGDC